MHLDLVLLLALSGTSPASTALEVDPEGAAAPRSTLWSAPRRIELAGTQSLTTFSNFVPVDGAPDGDAPYELAFTPDGTQVVIVHRATDNLTFFDVNTRTVTATTTVGDYPVHVAVTPNGQRALVPCVFANSLAVVDVASHTVVANIPLSGQQPYKVQVTPDGLWAVVGVINDGLNSAFSIVDLSTLSEAAVIPTTGQGVIGFYFTPESGGSGEIFSRWKLSNDGTKIVLPDRANSRVMVYDRITAGLAANIPTAANPAAVDVSNDATLAVVTHEFGTKRVTKIDMGTLTVSASFATTADLFDQLARITPTNGHAICASLNSVIFVDLTSGATVTTLSTGTVGDIEISHNGQYAFVSNFNSSVIDLATRTIVKVLTLAPTAESVVSPVALRAVGLNNRFREDVHVYNINGAAGFVEGFALTGSPPEGDAPRSIAVSADGRRAVVGNNTSRNVTIVDLVAGQVLAWVDTGERPLGVAITPDGTHAVVCNGDSDTVSIIDLATNVRVANLAVPTRPAEVRISPDSQTAYVTTIAGTDRLWFLNLAGAASSVISSLVTGQMGSANGYPYIGISGMELSADGSRLAVCISFDDQLMLVDTATRTEVGRVAVGDFPYQVAFKPDGTRAYVLHSFGDSVGVVNVAGAGSLIATVGGIDFPSTVNVSASGSHVYVANAGTSPGVRVIDTATNGLVATLSTPGNTIGSAALSSLEGVLYLAGGTSTGGNLLRVNAAGAGTSLASTTPLSAAPAWLGFSEATRTAVVCQPIVDGLDLERFDLTTIYCVGAPNSAGPGAHMGYAGTTSVSIDDFTLAVSGAVPFTTGLFYYGATQSQIPLGDGFRCAGAPIFRLLPATAASPSGTNARLLGFTAFPAGSGPGMITPGSTWNFSYWYRDNLGPGGTGFNFADGLSVVFTP